MPYQHVEFDYIQTSKKKGSPCGDAVFCQRTIYHTTIICADGIGSGVKAHVASQMNVARLKELLHSGYSLRDAFMSLTSTMDQWRDSSMPFSAFTVLRILNDGVSTVLGYEMPPPVFVDKKEVYVLEGEPLLVEAGVANEYHCRLSPGDGLFLMSDGITQAGLGKSLVNGWMTHGVEDFIGSCLSKGKSLKDIPREVINQADGYDGDVNGDDKTIAMAYCRFGEVVNLLTGPPGDRIHDAKVADDFMKRDGFKIVCGSTTADIVARHTNREVEVEQRPASFSTPPRYFIEDVDLVTEGAVTLNQVYNILDEDLRKNYDYSAAADLACVLKEADRINFIVGRAANPANKDLVYRKQGILSREKVVSLIAEKLERMGKLVDIHYL